MANIMGKIPEFTQDDTHIEPSEKELEGVKKAVTEKVTEEEKETPSELPAEEKPADEEQKPQSVDTGVLEGQVQRLQEERVKLLKDIQDLRGQRREIKKDELLKVDSKIDDLKDLHPDDITLIDRILRAKGYVSGQDVDQKLYNTVKDEMLTKFLEKYPEYKPENDPQDFNWSALQEELGFYRMPDNPRQIVEVLERAHRTITKVSSDRSISAKKRQLEVASAGAGNTQRSSSKQSSTLSSRYKEELQRGGWSEEDIKEIEKSLP